MRAAAAALLALAIGAVPTPRDASVAVATLVAPRFPLLPGSIVPLDVPALRAPYDVALVGDGSVSAHALTIPSDATGSATLIAANANGVAMRTLHIGAPPDASRAFLAVASYDDGIVIHETDAPFRPRGALAIDGAPADVAIAADGTIAGGATGGDTVFIAGLSPWRTHAFARVPLADEVAFDDDGDAFFTNRDIEGAGGITRVAPDGTVTTRRLGTTAEGLAIDRRAHRAYVANVNDGTISIVDTRTLVEIRRFTAVARVFSLALSADERTLYAVSNQSRTSPFGRAGSAVAIDVSDTPRVVATSRPLDFPVGIAIQGRRVFVTDEQDDSVHVLDARTLRALRDDIPTCRTPWKPTIDGSRLYVPCARDDRIDAIDAQTGHRIAGAPFATGGYPLAVAVWHPAASVKR